MKKLNLLLGIFSAFALMSCAGAKPSNEGSASTQKNRVANVAVVETEMDTRSGAAKDLNAAELSEITAELRRQAVKNLPKNKYNVMTSTTVQAQGAAVLEDCAEENCIITLGSKIGADFIVRGTISKFQKRFTLSVEIYDTEDGNLIVSSDPVRSEEIIDLLEESAKVSADMYKTFMETSTLSGNSKFAEDKETKSKDKPKKEDRELLVGEDAYKDIFSENWYGISTSIFPNIDDFMNSTLGLGFRADVSLSKTGPIMLGVELNGMFSFSRNEELGTMHEELDVQAISLANWLLAPKEVRTTNIMGGEIGIIRSWYLEAGPVYGINSENFGLVLGFGLRENATDNPMNSRMNGAYGLRLVYLGSIQIGITSNLLF